MIKIPKILTYSTMWDKLKPNYPALPESVKKVVGDVHHTTIRLDSPYYHSGIWQEVFKSRSPSRTVLRPAVEVQEPLHYFLYELEDLANGELVAFDTMENGIKMDFWVFRALIESFYRKKDCWKEDYTKMVVLPITIPKEPKISVVEAVKSKALEGMIFESKKIVLEA
ncbi:MAG: hypothetical protein KKB31_03600 [Nanoarchaeota archaeon]|nr:hypothetical protein [Nanoarchaeota archaeon]